MRLTDPRFLSDRSHRDFRYFLETQAGDLSVDANVDRMVELCFARKSVPGLDSTFWIFKNIAAADSPELKLEISNQIKKSDRTLGAIARIFIDEITRFSGCERAAVKFPVDIGHLAELISWFPDCRVMHITRDPRAMAMSKSNDPYGTALRILEHPRLAPIIRKLSIWRVIAQYRQTACVHQRFQHLPNYKLFRYEDLLANPDQTLHEVCRFIDVPFDSELLHPESGRHEHQASSLTGKQQKAFDRSAAIRWQEVISPFDRWLVTTLTRKSMQILGYDPDNHPIFAANRDLPHPVGQEVA